MYLIYEFMHSAAMSMKTGSRNAPFVNTIRVINGHHNQSIMMSGT